MARICDLLVEAGILFLIVFTPVYYGSVDLAMIAVIEVTILFMILTWGIGMVARGQFAFRKTPLDIPILLFCGYSVVSTFFFSRYAHASYGGMALVLCISALYFIVVNNIRSRSQLIRLFVVILLVGCVHAFSHLTQNATGLFSASTGVMLNVGNHFAGYMVIIIPLAVAMSFVVKDVGKRILLVFAGIVMTAAMAFSLIAGAMLVFLLSFGFIAVGFIRSGKTRKPSLILGGIVLCSILVILWFGHSPVLNELLTVTNLKTGSPAARLLIWKSSLAMFADSPVTGTGLGTYDHVFPGYRLPEIYGRPVYAHSDWLQLLSELGAIGFMIVLSGAGLFFSFIVRNYPAPGLADDWRKGLVAGGLSSVGAGIFHAMVDFNLHIPAIAALFAIIIAMTVTGSMYGRRSESRAGSTASDWKIHIPLPARIAVPMLLVLAIGFSTSLILRPCIAEARYSDGMKLETALYWDEAAGKYCSASEISPGNGTYLYALGNIYAKRAALNQGTGMQEKWYKLAVDAYARSIGACPMNGDYHLALGNLHELVGNTKAAGAEYLRMVSLDPNNAFYHRIYGTFCLKQGDIEKAIAAYRSALEVYPSDLHDILNKCYNILDTRQGDPDTHIPRLVSSICPRRVESHVTSARFLASKGWYDAAVSEYQKAVAIEPDGIRARKELSSLLVKQGEFDKAAAAWRQFLESHPGNAGAHAELAVIYVRLKRLDDAIHEYLAAADIEDTSSQYSTKAASLYMQQGKASEAVQLWQRAIQRNPYTAGTSYYQLGRYYEHQGNWLDALSLFQQAVNADPNNAGYLVYLAQSYYKRELFYEAAQEWERALKLRPEDVSVRLQLAGVYRRIDRRDKAKEHYLQVLKLEPGNAEAQKGLQETSEPV